METVIQLEHIDKIYQTGEVAVHAVRDVSLRIQRGEFVAVMGASGSGKSTLMNIVGCLDRATRGRYSLDGLDVSTLNRNQLAEIRNQKIGFVFQGFNLLARTSAVENVQLPLLYDRSGKKRDTHALAIAALESVGLGERVDHEPSELSGGQQQRVAIARALVTEPAIILADEPTGNLDPDTAMRILDLFAKEVRESGAATLLVTHSDVAASVADRTLKLTREGLVNGRAD